MVLALSSLFKGEVNKLSSNRVLTELDLCFDTCIREWQQTGGMSNKQKEHKKQMPMAAKRAKVAKSRVDKRKQQQRSGKQFRGKKAWKWGAFINFSSRFPFVFCTWMKSPWGCHFCSWQRMLTRNNVYWHVTRMCFDHKFFVIFKDFATSQRLKHTILCVRVNAVNHITSDVIVMFQTDLWTFQTEVKFHHSCVSVSFWRKMIVTKSTTWQVYIGRVVYFSTVYCYFFSIFLSGAAV